MNVAVRPYKDKPDKACMEPLEYPSASDYAVFRNICARVGAHYDGETFVFKRAAIPFAKQTIQGCGFTAVLDAALDAIVETAMVNEAIAEDLARTIIDSRVETWAPFPFQAADIAWLAPRENAGLFHEPGLGKTLILLMALAVDLRVLVVSPAGVKYNWLDEAKLRRPDYKITILEGMKSFRWPEKGEVVVTNYDILPGTFEMVKQKNGHMKRVVKKDSIPQCPGPVALIGDEVHKLRNNHTNQFLRWCAVRDAIPPGPGRHCWGATGTELLNRPTEFANILEALNLFKPAFGTWMQFVNDFGGVPTKTKGGGFGGFGRFRWPDVQQILANLSPELTAKIQSVSRKRLKRDVYPQLPAKVYKWIRVDLDKATQIQCDRTLAILKAKGIDLDDVQQHVELTAIEGAAFEELSKTRAALAVAKIKGALEIVEDFEEQGQPLVVFSAHRAPLAAIGARPGWIEITGDTPPKRRKEIVNEFAAGKYLGLACSIEAAGVGLDGMQRRASTGLFVDLLWVPDLNKQAEDRLCRIGQDRGVVIMRMVANHPVDSRVLELLAEKQALIEATTEKAAVRWRSAA